MQVAHRVDFDPAQKPAFDEPAFFRNFEHYPSAMIAKQEKLHLTEMAKEMQAGRAGFPFYYPSIPGLTQQSLQTALSLLGDPGELEQVPSAWPKGSAFQNSRHAVMFSGC